jgi:hypothetical protein
MKGIWFLHNATTTTAQHLLTWSGPHTLGFIPMWEGVVQLLWWCCKSIIFLNEKTWKRKNLNIRDKSHVQKPYVFPSSHFFIFFSLRWLLSLFYSFATLLYRVKKNLSASYISFFSCFVFFYVGLNNAYSNSTIYYTFQLNILHIGHHLLVI